MPIAIRIWTLIWFNDEFRTCLGNWFQGGNVSIKKMQKSFASYELKVLHYRLLNVEKTHHIFKSP
jgi:hypothetical protein